MIRCLPGLAVVLLIAGSVLAQTGGGFSLEQSVIGNGGWRSDGGVFTVLGTMGQSNSGSTAAGGPFNLIDGLWAIENQSPSAPFVRISGTVTRANGPGIPHVLVTIKNLTTNQTFTIFTGAQGVYELDHVPTGANYLITLSRQELQFEPESLVVFISQDRDDLNFVSQP